MFPFRGPPVYAPFVGAYSGLPPVPFLPAFGFPLGYRPPYRFPRARYPSLRNPGNSAECLNSGVPAFGNFTPVRAGLHPFGLPRQPFQTSGAFATSASLHRSSPRRVGSVLRDNVSAPNDDAHAEEFDFSVERNGSSEAISARNGCPNESQADERTEEPEGEDALGVERKAGSVVSDGKHSAAPQALYRREPNIAAIRHFIQSGRMFHLPGLEEKRKRVIREQAKSYVLEKGKIFVLLKGDRKREYVENLGRRSAILADLHETYGHIRRDEMVDRVTQTYYWKTMRDDVELFINQCIECQRRGKGLIRVRDTLKQIKIKSKAWDLVGMDLIEFPETSRGNRLSLTLIDHYPKWIEVVPLPNKEARTVAQALYNIYCRLGAPHRIVSDNGKEFANQVNRRLHELVRTKHTFIRPYTPRENGMTERVNRSIKEALVIECGKSPEDWDLRLEKAAFNIRNRKHRATGYSPHELFYSFNLRVEPGENPTTEEDEFAKMMESDGLEPGKDVNKECKDMFSRLQEIGDLLRQETSNNIQKEQARQKKSFDLRQLGKGHALQKGQLVMFRNLNSRNKLAGKKAKKEFLGPGVVLQALGSKAQIEYEKAKYMVENGNIRLVKDLPMVHSSSDLEQLPEHGVKRKRFQSLLEDYPRKPLPPLNDKARDASERKVDSAWWNDGTSDLFHEDENLPQNDIEETSATGRTSRSLEKASSSLLLPKRSVSRDRSRSAQPEDGAPSNPPSKGLPRNESIAATGDGQENLVRRRAFCKELDATGGARRASSQESDVTVGMPSPWEKLFPTAQATTQDDNVVHPVPSLEWLEPLQRETTKMMHLREKTMLHAETYQFAEPASTVIGSELPVVEQTLSLERKEPSASEPREIFPDSPVVEKKPLTPAGAPPTASRTPVVTRRVTHQTALKKPWITIETITNRRQDRNVELTREDYLRLSDKTAPGLMGPRGWLNNELIYAACILQQDQNPNVAGLKNTAELQFHPNRRTGFEQNVKALQPLFIHGNHFILVDSMTPVQHDSSDEPFVVNVYDSLSEGKLKTQVKDPELMEKVAALVNTSRSSVEIRICRCPQQGNAKDCGVFAVALMVAVCARLPVHSITFAGSKVMRHHLLRCLEDRTMRPFPTGTPSLLAESMSPVWYSYTFPVVCECRLPVSRGATVTCRKRLCPIKEYHVACVEKPGQQFVCKRCERYATSKPMA